MTTTQTTAAATGIRATGRITGLNHMVLVTNDMEKTLKFWCGILGLKVRATTAGGVQSAGVMAVTKGHDRLYFLDLPDGGMLAFIEFQKADVKGAPSHFNALWPEPPKDGIQARTMDHVAFNVETLEDLKVLREKLVANDVPCSPIQTLSSTPFVCSIYLYDPNGIAIEFSTWDFGDAARWEELKNEPWLKDPNPVPSLVPVERPFHRLGSDR